MVDISAFFTLQTGNNNGKGAAATQQALAAQTRLFAAIPGANFMDLIFARVADGELAEAAQTKPRGKDKTLAGKPDYTGHAEPLTAEQILHAALTNDQQALQKIGEILPEALAAPPTDFTATGNAAPETELTEPAAASYETSILKKLASILESLLAGLPQESMDAGAVFTARDKSVEARADTSAIANKNPGPALIATGLTPEKLTTLLEEIANGNEQGESFLIGLVNILPPEAKKETIFLPRGLVVARPQHPAGDVNTPHSANDLAARLNALVSGARESAGADASANANTMTTSEGDGAYEESDFEGVLRVLERAQNNGQKTGQQGDFDKGIANAIKQINKNVSAGLSTVQGAPPALSEIFTGFAMDSIYPEGLEFGYNAQHGQSLTGTAQLASLVSHAQQAGHPHPATQMVAATISKAASGGESKTISIQLDPPDLGRVAIRMQFHKDQTVKAVLMAEKPETYMMLQRDAHVLERALQEAGIDTDGSSLSFELAQDGNLFEHDQKDGKGTGGGSGGGKSANESETGTEIAIIQTTMDWYADPETGLMRYSALV